MDVDLPTQNTSQTTDQHASQSIAPLLQGKETDSSRRRPAAQLEEPEEGGPGYAWNNPKARAEFERAMEMVQDRDFSLSRSFYY